MTSPLIAGYVTGLHQSLPPAIADEAATGLIDTYQDTSTQEPAISKQRVPRSPSSGT